MKKKPPDHLPLQLGVAYGNAEVRGQLRAWKKELAVNYRRMEVALASAEMREALGGFVCKAGKGQQRAFAHIKRLVSPSCVLEAVRMDRKFPLSAWSILKPANSVTLNAPVESGRMQHCVLVNYLLLGRLPGRDDVAEGLWGLEVPDHALGRCIERSRLPPGQIVREAHRNLLALDAQTFVHGLRGGVQIYVPAGPGGFVCDLTVAADQSLHDEADIRLFANTWLSDDHHVPNHVIRPRMATDKRLGDSVLLPPPLRRFEATRLGDGKVEVQVHTWGGGIPKKTVSA
jgi:hypothetical protein